MVVELRYPRADLPGACSLYRWPSVLPPSLRALRPGLSAFIPLWVGAFFALQLLYIHSLPLVMDEFDGAYDVYLLRDAVPYADFTPYKTVLGYYLQLPVLLAAPDVWSGLIAAKVFLAVVSAASMALAAVLAARSFRPAAVAFALPLWVFMSNWLERASELRVDTLTGLAGLFGLLALLAGRPATAGGLVALSFLISQKGIYYLAASLAALACATAVSTERRATLRGAARFCAAYGALVLPYLLLFGVLSTWDKIASTTFLSHRAIIFTDLYPNIRKFWTQSLVRNPLFYALSVLALLALARRLVAARKGDLPRGEVQRDAQLFGYGVALAACGIWHKQPWPYFFVLLVPTGFVLQSALFEQLWRTVDRLGTRSPRLRQVLVAALIAVVIGFGVAHPALRIAEITNRHDQSRQEHTVKLASALLAPGEHYLAGLDLLYDREQSSSMLRRVSRARRNELSHADSATIDAILTDLQERPPKLLVYNERFRAFPKRVREFLRDHYADYWGNIRLYSPRFGRGKTQIDLAFAGVYELHTKDRASVRVNGRKVKNGESFALPRGPVPIKASHDGRLLLRPPDTDTVLDPRFAKARRLFRRAYSR